MRRNEVFPISVESSKEALQWSDAHLISSEYTQTIGKKKEEEEKTYYHILGMSDLHLCTDTVKNPDLYKKGSFFALKAVENEYKKSTNQDLPDISVVLSEYFNYLIDIDKYSHIPSLNAIRNENIEKTNKRLPDDDEFGPMDLFEALASGKISDCFTTPLVESFKLKSEEIFEKYTRMQHGLTINLIRSAFSPLPGSSQAHDLLLGASDIVGAFDYLSGKDELEKMYDTPWVIDSKLKRDRY